MKVSYFSSYKRWSDVQAGICGVRNPFLVDLNQFTDTLYQFALIKQLREIQRENMLMEMGEDTALWLAKYHRA